VKIRFLGDCGPKVCEILHLPRLSKTRQSNRYFLKKKEGKKPEGERPASFTFESYSTGILTSLDSTGSFCSSSCHFRRLPVDPLVKPGTVT